MRTIFSFSSALLLSLVTLTSAVAQQDRPTGPVGVLNFANLQQGNAKWDWLGKGLADMTIGDLVGQKLHVVSREQMQQIVRELELKKQLVDPKAVGRVMKVLRCIHGTYRVENGKARLQASLIHIQTGKLIHTAVAQGPEADILNLQKRLSAELIDVLRGNQPGTINPKDIPQWTENLATSELLYRGIDQFDTGDYLLAWSLFRRALQSDSKFADARYWSAKMMYYVQEYHQAAPDLEQFAVEYPKHPRVGDAVMELINSAQLSVADADEVLRVLKLAGKLAPKAEVANQFGAGYSSTVSIYTAGLAAQIYRSEKKYKEAFQHYAPSLKSVTREHPLYWIVWHEMFELRLKHLRQTGELLAMPPAPPYLQRKDTTHPPALSPGGMHPVNPRGWLVLRYGEFLSGGDDFISQECVALTPETPTAVLDFRTDPLQVQKGSWFYQSYTYTRYFYAPPGQHLKNLHIELRYRPDEKSKAEVRFEGDLVTEYEPLDGSGVFKKTLTPWAGARCVALRLIIRQRPITKSPHAIIAWKVTGSLDSGEPKTASLRLDPNYAAFNTKLDGKRVGVARIPRIIHGLTPGPHELIVEDGSNPRRANKSYTLNLKAGELYTKVLYGGIAPIGQAWDSKQINSPYEAFRLGANLGDKAGSKPQELCFLRDHKGRLIVIWELRRDLYLITSEDEGETWSSTRKLPAPVNSAHDDILPTLMQDNDGRYVLVFVSDRNLSYARRLYVSWSYDLEHFSAPVMMTQQVGVPLRTLQRADGTFLSYFQGVVENKYDPRIKELKDDWMVVTSKDLFSWTKATPLLPPNLRPKVSAGNPASTLDVIQHDGQFVLLGYWGRESQKVSYGLQMSTSTDGITFSRPKLTNTATVLSVGWGPRYIQLESRGKHLFAHATDRGMNGVLLRYQERNQWERISILRGIPHRAGFTWGRFLSRLGKNEMDYLSLQPGTAFGFKMNNKANAFVEDFSRFHLAPPLYRIRYQYSAPPTFPELDRFATPAKTNRIVLSHDATKVFCPVAEFVRGWDLATKKRILSTLPVSNASGMSLTRDDKQLLVAFRPIHGKPDVCHLVLYDIASEQELSRIPINGREIHGVAVSPNGKMGAINLLKEVNNKRRYFLEIWDLHTRQKVHQLNPAIGFGWLRFSPDGKLLATAEVPGKTLRLWNTETGQLSKELQGHGRPISNIRFTSDGTRVLTNSMDYSVRLWHLPTGKQLSRFPIRTRDIAVSHNGKMAAATTRENYVVVWDLDTQKELVRFPGHEDFVTELAFTQDDRRLVTVGVEGYTRTWQLPEQ